MAGHPLCGARPGQGTWFLAVALLSLALEIGANTTIFSVLHAVLYRLLPYQHSDRWMVVWQSSPGLEQPPPVAETVDWKRLNQAFEDLALTSRGEQGSFSGTGEPELIPEQDVTPNLFRLLNVQPILGRVFLPEEAQDRTQTVLISTSFLRTAESGKSDLAHEDTHVNCIRCSCHSLVALGEIPSIQGVYKRLG